MLGHKTVPLKSVATHSARSTSCLFPSSTICSNLAWHSFTHDDATETTSNGIGTLIEQIILDQKGRPPCFQFCCGFCVGEWRQCFRWWDRSKMNTIHNSTPQPPLHSFKIYSHFSAQPSPGGGEEWWRLGSTLVKPWCWLIWCWWCCGGLAAVEPFATCETTFKTKMRTPLPYNFNVASKLDSISWCGKIHQNREVF